jgi:hypothetical protein
VGVELTPVLAGQPMTVNWNSWVLLEILLVDCQVDLGLFSAVGDGGLVDEASTREWANAIDEHLFKGDLVAVDIPDRHFTNGVRTRVRVLASQVRNPVPPAGVEVEERWRMATRLRADGFVLSKNLGLDVVEVDPGDMVVRELTEQEAAWLGRFATFCMESGGFYQH